jgi:Fic family protein
MFDVTPAAHQYEIEQLEQIRFRIDRFLIMPKHEEWFRREAFVRQAYSSTMIENASITPEELTLAASELSINRPDVVNYGSALEFVDFLSGLEGSAPDELVVREGHRLLMRNIRDDHYLPGQYRRDTNWREDEGRKVYQPPHQIDVPILMREFVVGLREQELHPILKAGLAHLHLVAIHPFVDGNGRTARLLATLWLQRSGWGFRRLLSLDSFYQRNRDDYIAALASSLGDRFRSEYDAGPWLKFFCGSVLTMARRLESRLTEWNRAVEEAHKLLRPLGLLDRQIDGLVFALRKGEITRRDYLDIAGVSPLTGTRDLALLVEKGVLRPHGAGRNRVYRLTEGLARSTSNVRPQRQQDTLT